MRPALTGRSVALLRGMNLGGRRITNGDLRGHFEALGFTGVGIFRASGNVFFDDPGGDLVSRIERGLRERLGYPVATFVRTADELAEIVAQRPFSVEQLAASRGKVQVTVHAQAPTPQAARAVLDLATDADRLALVGRELYWLPSGGISESDLDTKAIARALGDGTTRTLGTLELLLKKVQA